MATDPKQIFDQGKAWATKHVVAALVIGLLVGAFLGHML